MVEYSITEAQFEVYEEVRKSGITNMWDTRKVAQLASKISPKKYASLTPKDVVEIIKNYEQLHLAYPNVRCGACEGRGYMETDSKGGER